MMTVQETVTLSLEAAFLAAKIEELTPDQTIMDRINVAIQGDFLTHEFLDRLRAEYVSAYHLEPGALDTTPEVRRRIEAILPMATALQEILDAIRRAERQ